VGSFTDTYNDLYMRVLIGLTVSRRKSIVFLPSTVKKVSSVANLTISADLPGLLAPEESLN